MFDIRYKFEVQVECIPSEHNIRIKIILISTHCMERERKKRKEKVCRPPRAQKTLQDEREGEREEGQQARR